jgi:hypothetical protein
MMNNMIRIEVPVELEEQMRRDFSDLDLAAKEAMGVELFRLGKLSHAQLANLLGLSRYETDGVLKQHGAYFELTLDDVVRDARASRQARGA